MEKPTLQVEKTEPITSGQQKRQWKGSTVWAVFGMSWGSLALGYAAAMIGTTLGQPSFYEYMGLDTAKNAAQLIGATNSLFYTGGFFGAILNAWYADRFGRRIAIATGATIVMFSSALQAGSVNIAMFIVFRFTNGFGNLMLMISIPLWITEFVPPDHRGALANIHAVMINCGYLLSAYCGVGFYYWTGGSGNQWRVPLALGCIPALINLAVIPFIPESPRYLLEKGQIDKAWKVVRKLHSRDDDPDHEYAAMEFYQLRQQLELNKRLDSSWIQMLRRPSYRKRVFISCSLLSLIYCTGTLVIANYGPTLFKGLGFSPAQSLLFQAGNILSGLSSVIVSVFVVDRFPRNKLLATGMAVCVVTVSLVAAMNASFIGTANKPGLAAGVACIYIYVWFYGVLLDGIGYWYAAEIFPTHLRAKGTTCCLCAYCLVNIMWLQVAPIAFDHIGWKFYLVFICITIPGAIFMYFYYPDTLNKPLEEVARLFGDEDLVAVYQEDITRDHRYVSDQLGAFNDNKAILQQVETADDDALQEMPTQYPVTTPSQS